MKRRNLHFGLLLIILFFNIVFTQKMVHQYYYENYLNALLLCGLNVILFPASYLIYRLDRKRDGAE